MSDETATIPAWASWRRVERSRLIAARLAMSAQARREGARLICAALDRLLPEPGGLVVAVYWPIRGEPDLREWVASIRSRGARCALPVVAARSAPLVFREWRAEARLVPGVWNIPEPADGEALAPQVVIAPLVGHDHRGYRLGYGVATTTAPLRPALRAPLPSGSATALQRSPASSRSRTTSRWTRSSTSKERPFAPVFVPPLCPLS